MGVDQDAQRVMLWHLFRVEQMMHGGYRVQRWRLMPAFLFVFIVFIGHFLFSMSVFVTLVAEKEMMKRDFENITEMCPLKRWIS